MSDDRPDYDQQLSDESDQAFQYFTMFRDKGPKRVLAELVDSDNGIGMSTLIKWALNHDWYGRAHAHDLAMQRSVQSAVAFDF